MFRAKHWEKHLVISGQIVLLHKGTGISEHLLYNFFPFGDVKIMFIFDGKSIVGVAPKFGYHR